MEALVPTQIALPGQTTPVTCASFRTSKQRLVFLQYVGAQGDTRT